MKDNEILALYLARDESAIKKTADKYGNYCNSISYNILHNREDAEECVNDTWLGAWNSIPPQYPSIFSVYLGRITRNLSINRYKKYTAQKRGEGQTELLLSEIEECIPDRSSVEDSFDERALVDAINRFLYLQKEEKRNIFIRRYWYMLPLSEIASAYSMSEGNVKTVLFRMRAALKCFLEKEGIEV